MLIGKLDIRLVRLYTAQIVHALEYLETKKIMHRDLKPQNIMLDNNYNIKLIDFGDAKKEDEPPLEEEEQPNREENGDGSADFADDMMSMHSDGSERRGTLVGTMNYLAPEMI